MTSMAGSWAAIVEGFAGLLIKNDQLTFSPYLPAKWESYSFKLAFRGRRLQVTVAKEKIEIEMSTGEDLMIEVYGQEQLLQTGVTKVIPTP